ncbi:hypothetical protein [Anaeromyxobacter paludicola]|uniref:Lipoprotein n=1 Tax=Anaeromyxobacter paludicola TaxID=2918171 RepID=A0ABM7X5P6_9BACT|nr:hypothetical protein [Anaeromyxobacter paludicola]BDG07136.1 hypothetical protein AMPC_02490 [Anaeromyxobacter paludicola]
MRRLLLCALLLAAACAPSLKLGEGDRQKLVGELEGRRRFTRVALYVGGFFGDRGRLLLSDQPFGELDLLEEPDGTVIPPPGPDAILPPGTPVRIQRVEFPTGWTVAQRIAMTPRYHPWVELSVKGEELPAMVVLPQDLASREEALGELDRLLASDDPAPRLAALPAEQRQAVLEKRLVEGMGQAAVELAWGLPEKRHIDRPARSEEWSWASGRRRASFKEDRLVKFEEAKAPKAPAKP